MRGTSNGSTSSSGGGGVGGVGGGRGPHGRPQPRPANSMEQDSFDSFEDDESELQQQMQGLRLGVPANGLGGSNGSVNSGGSDRGVGVGVGVGVGGVGGNNLNAAEEEEHELPKSVIVTNVDLSVFDTQEGKVSFKETEKESERASMWFLSFFSLSLSIHQVKYLRYFSNLL